ncbi:MAG: EamA family transporter [Candidatus Micrarchaeota archaeon]|nr:EamA family transporter [Candidatus Micrarchaeota archaeon]MDE1804471.1 EamA family transporter [Candidatus Micrarchaeota archaeon]MDE1846640.1 EamA family transporter [Candidatus Micrarchaeota archaeon]
MRLNALAYVFLISSILLGALVPVAFGFGTKMNIPEFLFLVSIAASATMLVFVVLKGRTSRLIEYLTNPRDLGVIAAIGILQYAVWGYGFLYAERFVSVSLAAAIYRTFPLLMLIFLPFVLRERVTKYQVAALGLALLGLVIALSGSLNISAGSDFPIILLLIGVALSNAFTSVMIKKMMFDIYSSMFLFNITNSILFGSIFLLGGFSPSPISASELIAIAYMGVVGFSTLGVMYYSALRMLKTTLVTNLYFLSPFLTFIYSFFIFGEAIRPYYIAIAALVGVGLFLQKADALGGTYLQKGKQEAQTIFDVTSAFINCEEERINSVIKRGGRVLAVKMSAKHKEALNMAIFSQNGFRTHLYTDLHNTIKRDEAQFIREIMGIEQGEIALLSAGEPTQSEQELRELSARTSGLN